MCLSSRGSALQNMLRPLDESRFAHLGTDQPNRSGVGRAHGRWQRNDVGSLVSLDEECSIISNTSTCACVSANHISQSIAQCMAPLASWEDLTTRDVEPSLNQTLRHSPIQRYLLDIFKLSSCGRSRSPIQRVSG
jgi:hypothetical protein